MKPPEMTLKLGGPTTLCVGVCCEVQVSYIGSYIHACKVISGNIILEFDY